jgi:hypothetical protein
MILASHGLIASQITQFVGLLDLYPSAAAAYSLRKLRATYTSSAIRVRRTNNDELDIGFTSTGALDTSALLAFTGTGALNNGFVTKWYDQSGNARDSTQTTALDQPQIVSSGSVILENGKPAIKFLANKLETSTFTLSAQPITRIVVVKPNNTTQMSFMDGSSTNRGRMGFDVENVLFAGSSMNVGTKQAIYQLFYGLFDGSSSEIIRNGVLLGTGNPGTQGLDKVILASHPTVRTIDLNGTMQEAIIYPSNQNTNRTGIETNINDFYSIY